MKCIVYGCTNKKRDGMFYGGICASCYEYLTTGIVGPTDSFLNDLYKLRKYPKPKSKENLITKLSDCHTHINFILEFLQKEIKGDDPIEKIVLKNIYETATKLNTKLAQYYHAVITMGGK